jgi:hypothetical protein
LQIAFPTSEPAPVRIDVILRTAINASVDGLRGSAASLRAVGLAFFAATTVLSLVRIHIIARTREDSNFKPSDP